MYVASQIKSGWGAEMYTQRNKERRRFSGKTSFPLVTEAGCEVEKDRRCSPDRRLGNIHLELVDADDHGYSECFANTSFDLSDWNRKKWSELLQLIHLTSTGQKCRPGLVILNRPHRVNDVCMPEVRSVPCFWTRLPLHIDRHFSVDVQSQADASVSTCIPLLSWLTSSSKKCSVVLLIREGSTVSYWT